MAIDASQEPAFIQHPGMVSVVPSEKVAGYEEDDSGEKPSPVGGIAEAHAAATSGLDNERFGRPFYARRHTFWGYTP